MCGSCRATSALWFSWHDEKPHVLWGLQFSSVPHCKDGASPVFRASSQTVEFESRAACACVTVWCAVRAPLVHVCVCVFCVCVCEWVSE